MLQAPVGGPVEGALPKPALRGFRRKLGIAIVPLAAPIEVDCESLAHQRFAEVRHFRRAANGDDAVKIVATARLAVDGIAADKGFQPLLRLAAALPILAVAR